MLDKLGRPSTKACPDCSRELGRTACRCPDCGHQFIGHEKLRQMRSVDAPMTLAAAVPAVDRLPESFDCIALDDGRLRLCLPSGDVLLTAEQRVIVAIELGAPTR